jgi:hypothetical protein
LVWQELQKSAQLAMARPSQRPAAGGPTSEQILAVENGLKQVLHMYEVKPPTKNPLTSFSKKLTLFPTGVTVFEPHYFSANLSKIH